MMRDFIEEIKQFGKAFYYWLVRKTLILANFFEAFKDFWVKRLLWRRGTLSRAFLHTGFGAILSFGIIAAPIIANTYPTLGADNKNNEETPSSVLNTQTASTMGTVTLESEKPRDKILEYTVQKGDSFSSIAEKFQISTETVLWQNNLSATDTLAVGQKLEILPLSGVSHTVSAGETIYTIATKYKLASAQPIVDFPFNTFRDDETFALNIGDTIVVPGGDKTPAPKQYQPSYIAQIPQYTGGGSGSFIWPVYGIITQERNWYHTGIDIANSESPNIAASATGRVIAVIREAWGYGWHVIVDHGNFQTLYAHLQRIDVAEGQDVDQGQVLGQMGNTGRSTGTHLHFEIRQGGAILSPRDFLK